MIAAQENRWWERVEERFQCVHTSQSLVRYQQGNGQWRVRRQCCDCGEFTTSDQPQRNIAVMSLPIFNSELRDSKRAAKKKAYNDSRTQYIDNIKTEEQTRQQLWWANYNAYLKTPHWQQLRRAVLQRDQHKCQNCFCSVTDTSAHVHHLSYVGFERVGHSFAFECVTLCSRCHVDFHPHMQP